MLRRSGVKGRIRMIRKWMACLLVLMLCACGAMAEESCLHENAVENGRTRFNSRHLNTGSEMEHLWMYDYCADMWCPDCGLSYYGTEVVQDAQENREHWLNENGVCAECGYGSTCAHENAYDTYTCEHNRYTTTGDLLHHLCTYDRMDIRICSDCNLWLYAEAVVNRDQQTNEMHSWNEENTCSRCGQKNICPHANREDGTRNENWQYEDIGDTLKHRGTYDVYDVVNCADCGLELSRTYSHTEEYMSEHGWNEENICWDCGRVNECTHLNTKAGTREKNHQTVDIGDPLYHQYTFDVYNLVLCADCGVELLEEYARSETQEHQHSWNEEGVCWSCERVNDCAHGDTRTTTHSENGRDEDIGDPMHHQYSCDQYEAVICNTCGLELSKTYTGTLTWMNRHEWNEEGVCPYCGRVNNCAHESTQETTRHDNWNYEDTGDSMYHRYTYDEYDVVECAVCGLTLSKEYARTREYTYRHNWNEENTCWDCGRVNDCTHDATQEEETEDNHRYESTGDLSYHLYKYDVYAVNMCSGCGIEISREFDRSEEHEWTHNWDDGNVCMQCKQENTCEHANVNEYISQENLECVPQDEEAHVMNVRLDIRKVCRVCNMELALVEGDVLAMKEGHNWRDGECWRCGMANPCTHAHAVTRYRYDYYDHEDLEDGVSHRVTVDTYSYVRCYECDYQTEQELIGTETITEAHVDGYECDCGYVRPCSHENTYTDTWYNYDKTEADNDQTHTRYGYLCTSVYCEDCGYEISYEESEELTAYRTEKHNFGENGECTRCDYPDPTPCTHAHTATLTNMTYYGQAVDYSDHVHMSMLIAYTYTGCTDCGKNLGNISDVKQTARYEEHMYNEYGVCYECAHVNACRHDGETYTEEYIWDWWDSQMIDEQTHMIDGTLNTITYCALCRQEISSEISERCEIVRPHEMDGDTCMDCEYTTGCAHANIVERTQTETDDALYYVSISSNAHAAVCNVWKQTYCADCGIQLWDYGETKIGTTRVNAAHEMKDGLCVDCGYCTHPAGQLVTEQEQINRAVVYYNAYLHQISATNHYTQSCSRCGEVAREWNMDGFEYYAQHNWEDGVCTGCGTALSCAHKNAYRVRDGGHMDSYADLGDGENHQLTTQWYTVMHCPDCLQTWDRQLSDETETGIKPHSYNNRSGVCACGYEDPDFVPCTHENTFKRRSLEGKTWYEYVDENVHNHCGNITEYEVCRDCSLRHINEVLVEVNGIYGQEEHAYSEAGVCVCGYQNPCTHTNTAFRYAYGGDYYKQYDAKHHKRVYVYNKVLYCVDCDARVMNANDTIESTFYQEHRFNSDGVCSDCYFINTCAHANTETYLSNSWVNSCVPVDEIHHSMTLRTEEIVHCLDCGEMTRTIVSEQDVLEPHEAYGCELCGYDLGEEHEHVLAPKDDSDVVSAEAIDDVTHSAVKNVYTDYYCTICGEHVDFKFEGMQTIVEPHSFGTTDRCSVCGYVSLCVHEETETQRSESFAYSYAQLDDAQHSYLQDYRLKTVCAHCGKELSYGEEIGVQMTAAHTYSHADDVSCNGCGYVRTQRPECRIELPANLTAIEAEAFAGNMVITHVVIPSGVTSIAESAFDGCSVTIVASEGSYAQQWALANGFAFEALSAE